MSIQAEIVSSGGYVPQTANALADLARRVSSLEAARTVIEAGTITAGTIAAGSITSTEIAAGTIQASNIAAATITAYNIAAGTITAINIAAGTITATQIAAGTITATNIAAGSITTGNIAAGAITSALISAGAINAGHIQAGSIDATRITANTITAAQIAAGTITATQIAAATILAGNIAAHTITANQIAAGTITATEILAGTITATQIASHTITAAVIAAGTITATEIASATITGGLIAATTITAANIAAGTITSTQLAANSVTATQIVSGAVDATKINVTSLSAISANLGTITAGTVTGATLQSASSGARVVLNTGGITAYNASNVPQLAFDVSTGNLTLTGTVTANATSVLPVGALSGLIGGGSFVQNGGFEDPSTTSGWTTNANVQLSGTVSQARSGGRSATMTSLASGTMSIIATSAAQSLVQANANHTAAAWFKAATAGRTVRVHINWYTAANAFISTSSSTAATVDNTGIWTRTTLTAAAPATAAFARVIAEVVGTGAAAEAHYVDDITLAIGDYATDVPSFPANTIVGSQIIADQITAREIAASTITATEIAANTITAGQIATGTITATQIAAGTITATQLSATAIDSMVVTGATIRTNANAQVNQVVMDSAGFRAYGDKLAAPTNLTQYTAPFSGGVFGAGTYYWKVTALNNQGESLASNEYSLTLTAGQQVYLKWDIVAGATRYRVYRGTSSGGQTGYVNPESPQPAADAGTMIALDTGATLIAATVPVANTAITIPINVTTSGLGTITGATYRTSETHPRTQIDVTNGLSMTDSVGSKVWSLSASWGLVSWNQGTGPNASDPRQISFLDGTNYRGQIGSHASNYDLYLQATVPVNTSQSKLLIRAECAGDSEFLLTGASTTVHGSIVLKAGVLGNPGSELTRTLLSGSGASDYLQLGNVQTFSAAGPPPVSWSVVIKSSVAAFIMSGSAYDTVVGKHTGFPIFFNGIQRSGFDFYFNATSQHMALPSRFFVVTGLSPGTYTLSVNASGGTMVADNQDTFTAMVFN